jgi:hypothetical protein
MVRTSEERDEGLSIFVSKGVMYGSDELRDHSLLPSKAIKELMSFISIRTLSVAGGGADPCIRISPRLKITLAGGIFD